MKKGIGSLGWILLVASVILALMNQSIIGTVVDAAVPEPGTTDNTPAVDKAKELAGESVTAPLWLWIILFVVIVLIFK